MVEDEKRSNDRRGHGAAPGSRKQMDRRDPEKDDEDEHGPGHPGGRHDRPKDEYDRVNKIARGGPIDDIGSARVLERFLEKPDLGQVLGKVGRRRIGGEQNGEGRQGHDHHGGGEPPPSLFAFFGPRFALMHGRRVLGRRELKPAATA